MRRGPRAKSVSTKPVIGWGMRGFATTLENALIYSPWVNKYPLLFLIGARVLSKSSFTRPTPPSPYQ